MSARKGISNTFVWILLGLLIVGLAGFGATNLSGTVRTVGSVGDKLITVDEYYNALQQEVRAIEAQTRERLPMSQVQAIGLDRQVLSRVVTIRALDNEASQIGLSLGDRNLQQQILDIPAFRDISGNFDREAYRFALSQSGLNETEFEESLREDAARTLLQGAVIGGTVMPDRMARVIATFVAERREISFAILGERDLTTPLPSPTDAQIRAFYDANPDAFTLPETKRLTYVLLSPDMMLDGVDVPEDTLRALYDERSATYNQPERRLVERLVYLDEATAGAAMAQLDVGGTTFELLAQDRGLSLSDLDMGDVTEAALGAAGPDVFAAQVGDVVGPLPSALGPALFRVNAVLAARATSFEEAREELRVEYAADRARRLVEANAPAADDLLAGGATLEEVAEETEFTLGTLDWSEDSDEGPAAYPGFRRAAAAITLEDFPAIDVLEDGSAYALRLDTVLPPRPEPFDSARNRAQLGWERETIEAALLAQTEPALTALSAGSGFETLGVEAETTEVTRTGFVSGVPDGFVAQVFEMTEGAARAVAGDGELVLVRLDRIIDPSDDPDQSALIDTLRDQLNQSLAEDLFQVFAADVQRRGNPQIDPRALNAVHASMP